MYVQSPWLTDSPGLRIWVWNLYLSTISDGSGSKCVFRTSVRSLNDLLAGFSDTMRLQSNWNVVGPTTDKNVARFLLGSVRLHEKLQPFHVLLTVLVLCVGWDAPYNCHHGWTDQILCTFVGNYVVSAKCESVSPTNNQMNQRSTTQWQHGKVNLHMVHGYRELTD